MHAAFAHLVRSLAAGTSRRWAVRALAGLGVAPALDSARVPAKKRKRVTRNGFGCVDVGRFCKNDGQCCSGICRGKKGKKKCRAHNTGGCRAGQDSCLGPAAPCGAGRNCFRTTGKAGFCTAVAGSCAVCARDPDCPEDSFGSGAACVVCAGECPQTGGTACFPAAA